MMMETTPAQDWDVVWNYTMGLPEENGFEKAINTNPQVEMTENGLKIIPGVGYVRYTPIGFETCNEGIYESEVLFYSFGVANGFRMILSDGTSGLQIFCNQEAIKFQGGILQQALKTIQANTEYKIRIERINEINRIFLNDEKIYETEALSEQYATGNRVFCQNNGEYLLKSIKFMKIS